MYAKMEENGMDKVKTCFTINQHRTTEEFKTYEELIKNGLFQGIEIFYPYDKTLEEQEVYKQNVLNLMKYNIEVVLHLPHGHRSDLLNENDYKTILQRFKGAIDFANNFNVNKLTLHLGSFNNQSLGRKYFVSKSIETIKILADYCYPMNLMIENMPGYNELGYSPDEIKEIIEGSNRSNVKFIFDFGHANVSDYSIDEYIEKLGKYLMHLHISDNNGLSDQHRPIGCGNIDYKNIFQLLKEYNELYCLEIIYKTDKDLINYLNSLKNVL